MPYRCRVVRDIHEHHNNLLLLREQEASSWRESDRRRPVVPIHVLTPQRLKVKLKMSLVVYELKYESLYTPALRK